MASVGEMLIRGLQARGECGDAVLVQVERVILTFVIGESAIAAAGADDDGCSRCRPC